MNLLTIKNVSVKYPDGTVALDSVSFSAKKGEIIAIIGRSGSGKSTLLRCINGTQPPTSGSIQLESTELTALRETQWNAVRRQIGFIWQEHNLVDRMSAMRNVLTGRLGHNAFWKSLIGYFGRSHREIAVHNLERVQLLHRANLRADRLSGGEKQRAAIARAMSQEPKLILADEPVASLDPELAWSVLCYLTPCCREDDVLALITLHQVEFAQKCADRILGLAEGKIVFDGTPGELTDSILDTIYRYDKPVTERSIPLGRYDDQQAVSC